MSRLSLLASLAALALLGGGASGFALSRKDPRPAPAMPAAELPSAPSKQSTPAPGGRLLRLSKDESLAAILLRAGVGGLDAALAERATANLDVRWDRPARLSLGRPLPGGARQLDQLELRGTGSRAFVLTPEGDGFTVQRITLTVDDTPVRLQLGTGPGLPAALRAAALPESLRTQLLALAGRSRGSRLDVIAAHEEAAGQSLYGHLLYVAVISPAGEVRRWLGDDHGRLRPLGRTEGVQLGLERPVSGPITSAMGLRLHPVLRFLRWHRGTDFAAPPGTPVRAAAPGRIVEAGWRGGYGQVVRLAHADGSLTAYAHLSRIDARVGETIPGGSVIGLVGATGLATGPHLHFEWLKDGRAMEPSFTRSEEQPLDPATLASLSAILAAPYREPPSFTRSARAEATKTEALKGPA